MIFMLSALVILAFFFTVVVTLEGDGGLMILGLTLIVLGILGIFYVAEVSAWLGMVWLLVIHLSWLTYIKTHPLEVILYTSAYFLVGALWSLIKWWFVETDRVRIARDKYESGKYSKTETWDQFKRDYKTRLDLQDDQFWVWIAFWPFSAAWTLLDDPIRRIAQRIYRELRGVYQKITDYVWR